MTEVFVAGFSLVQDARQDVSAQIAHALRNRDRSIFASVLEKRVFRSLRKAWRKKRLEQPGFVLQYRLSWRGVTSRRSQFGQQRLATWDPIPPIPPNRLAGNADEDHKVGADHWYKLRSAPVVIVISFIFDIGPDFSTSS
jgi:hypothetical protein